MTPDNVGSRVLLNPAPLPHPAAQILGRPRVLQTTPTPHPTLGPGLSGLGGLMKGTGSRHPSLLPEPHPGYASSADSGLLPSVHGQDRAAYRHMCA